MIENIEICFGCTACAIACPHKAIKIKRDKDGFIKPILDTQKCIGCGICRCVCPSLKIKVIELMRGKCQIGYYTGISENSSSGGVAYAIAEYAISLGEKVCAVKYNTANSSAEHIVVERKDELNSISGSKYLQSNPYMGLKNILREKSGVIFGTPCQIAGVRNILNLYKVKKNFLLVDIFCHGVPSELLWHNHLEFLEKQYGINRHEEVSFRQKSVFSLKIGKYYGDAQVDPFYHMYLTKCVYAEACYQCPFRRKSAADIRLGDYFLERDNPQSVIITLTNSGRIWLDNLSEKRKICIKNASFSDVDKVQDVDAHMPLPRTRERYLELLRAGKSPAAIMGKHRILLQRIKGVLKKILGKN